MDQTACVPDVPTTTYDGFLHICDMPKDDYLRHILQRKGKALGGLGANGTKLLFLSN